MTQTPRDAQTPRTARLALEDGAVFTGVAFGATDAATAATAEVVFNTAMTGYQEALTDPSYTGQILVMTAPMIGNYGVNPGDTESGSVKVAGFVCRELARRHSNFAATGSLSDYLRDSGVLGIEGVDTRAITRRLRTFGAMRGVLTDDESLTDARLIEMATAAPPMTGQNLVDRVAVRGNETFTKPNAGGPRILLLDCGFKRGIAESLAARGCAVEIIPHDTPGGVILDRYARGEFDGLLISNGPGDPAAVSATIESIRTVLDAPAAEVPPTLGICLGQQLIALAIGAETYKMKFGHRGANQPVRVEATGRVEITSQNHGFAVDRESLERAGGVVTHVHLNDDTLAGFRLTDKPVIAVQHHPEASPGPHDAAGVFDAFLGMVRDRAGKVG
jgi:carbamoyl-phosphate synthase small subunit